MIRSDSIVTISKALIKAQRKMGAATKGASNPFFKSKYADLPAVMEACKQALNDENILVLQPVVTDNNGVTYVETVLLHESGEFISGTMKVTEGKNMQELGSAISYARRYGLQSMAFIPAEDDDGEKAVGRKVTDVPNTTNKIKTISVPSITKTEVKTEAPVAETKVEVTETTTKVKTKPTTFKGAGKVATNGSGLGF